MSKERLDEIKEKAEHKSIIKNYPYIDENNPVTFLVTMEEKHFNWLIEQAERVQELEDKLARIRFVNNDYDKQNRRYQEALVKLRNDVGKIKTGYEKNVFVIKTVDDALIDWEALE